MWYEHCSPVVRKISAGDDAFAAHQPIQLGSARQTWLSAGNEGTWKQTKDEIEINIPLEDRARAKDIACQITSTTLRFVFASKNQQYRAVCMKSVMQTNQAGKSSAEKSRAMASLPIQRPDASK